MSSIIREATRFSLIGKEISNSLSRDKWDMFRFRFCIGVERVAT
ncbi:MAG: hypothetical protein DHS20C05_23420 [Hyphococcus sp.]|nr:MAG: hypothetical protein DHS20C05_23420 [Marinicaulis sp.]